MSSERDPRLVELDLGAGRELVPKAHIESWEDVNQSSTVEQGLNSQ